MESEEDMGHLPYYHGMLSKAITERVLTKEGDFLIRLGGYTISADGQKQPLYVLSINVSSNNYKTIHVLIRQRGGRVAVDFGQDKNFKTIQEFVDSHWLMEDSIAKDEHVILRRAITVHDLQELDRINVSNAVWVETLKWICRATLGTTFALVNAAFDAMVDRQLRERLCWKFAELHICNVGRTDAAQMLSKNDNSTQYFAMPLAHTPLPDSVAGFQSLSIWYINDQVITFLYKIRRLLSADIALEFCMPLTEHRSWATMAHRIWPLVHNGIRSLTNMSKADLALLHKHVSPTVLFDDCANLRRIHSHLTPQCDADEDDPLHVAARELYAWMHWPRAGDSTRPLVLHILSSTEDCWDQFVDSLFKSFQDAALPSNYIVYTTFSYECTQQQQQQQLPYKCNVLTRERMQMFSITDEPEEGDDEVITHIMLMRSSVAFSDKDLLQFVNRVDEQLENLVIICIRDDKIGPLLQLDY